MELVIVGHPQTLLGEVGVGIVVVVVVVSENAVSASFLDTREIDVHLQFKNNSILPAYIDILPLCICSLQQTNSISFVQFLKYH